MKIPHSKPTIEKGDIDAATAVLKSGFIAQGKVVKKFENAFAKYHEKRGGAAVSSGTAALHLALLALGIGRGDSVIIPSYVCIALYNAVKYTGAEPILADTVKDGWDMDAQQVENYLKNNPKKRVKAIVVVHLFGKPVNMDDYMAISKRYSIPIIEDCAMAVGAEYKGKKTGSFGEVSIFSFYATKVMTTGEGGMVISNSKEILDKVKDLRDYDEKKDSRSRFNYKMTDFQAAMGITQLKKLPVFIKKRRETAKKYINGLRGAALLLPETSAHCKNIYYRFVVMMNKPDRFIKDMEKKGIICRKPVFMPIHKIINSSSLPNTENIWKHAVSLPIYPTLKEGDVKRVILHTKKVLERL